MGEHGGRQARRLHPRPGAGVERGHLPALAEDRRVRTEGPLLPRVQPAGHDRAGHRVGAPLVPDALTPHPARALAFARSRSKQPGYNDILNIHSVVRSA